MGISLRPYARYIWLARNAPNRVQAATIRGTRNQRCCSKLRDLICIRNLASFEVPSGTVDPITIQRALARSVATFSKRVRCPSIRTLADLDASLGILLARTARVTPRQLIENFQHQTSSTFSILSKSRIPICDEPASRDDDAAMYGDDAASLLGSLWILP